MTVWAPVGTGSPSSLSRRSLLGMGWVWTSRAGKW